jgi:hypothetical protein
MSCKILTEQKYKTRPSPPYHADNCRDKIMKGNNGKQFISRPDKNGSYKWYPISHGKTPEDYYSQFPDNKEKKYQFLKKTFNAIAKELEEKNILLFHVGWNKIYELVDNAWIDAEKLTEKSKIVKEIRKTGDKNDVHKLVSFLFYTEHRRYWSEITGELYLQNNILKKDVKDVKEIFTKYFGNNFVWNGSNKKTILIKLQKK